MMALGAWDVFLRMLTLVLVLAVVVGVVRWLLDVARSRHRPKRPKAEKRKSSSRIDT